MKSDLRGVGKIRRQKNVFENGTRLSGWGLYGLRLHKHPLGTPLRWKLSSQSPVQNQWLQVFTRAPLEETDLSLTSALLRGPMLDELFATSASSFSRSFSKCSINS
jgi:hypothetical protein